MRVGLFEFGRGEKTSSFEAVIWSEPVVNPVRIEWLNLMIPNFADREYFASVLHTNVSPTSPIESQEHLYGREKQVRQIEQALYAPGRSIFIYGDRGVGKTSLAQTVAYSHQSASNQPVLLACSPSATFSGLMSDVIAALRGPQQGPRTTTTTLKASIPKVPAGIEVGHTRKEEPIERTTTLDLNSAVEMLLQIGKLRDSENTVVVLDEFDRLTNDAERTHFADFIKQIGDKHIPIRFVFCGVAESIQKLLGAHESCFRYLEGVELQRLSWDGRFEIIDTAARALGVTIESRPRTRIAAISDGFPHYIHLICEKLFWQMFNDEAPCTIPNADHYREAIAEAVMGIEQHLRTTYEQAAVLKDTQDYEEVLWAVADHADLFRNTESIYESYLKLFGPDQLDRPTVVSRLNTLKGGSCGRILTNWNEKKGWYEFRESIMRGYVRLRAEEQGVELALDFAAATGSSASLAWPVRGARRTRMTSRSDWDKTKNPSGF